MGALELSAVSMPLAAELRGEDARFSQVSIDTRTLKQGDLFVALRGDHFDGHRFLSQAESAGACAAVVSLDVKSTIPTLKVQNTLSALGDLASINRSIYKQPLVAITGSAGKTTVKNILSAIASISGPTLATQSNFNNEVGVPLTLLNISEEHQFAIVEMGAAQSGDISYLCAIAEPNVAVLLNAMPAHLSGFGSVEGVAAAKGEIFAGLESDDTAVINRDSEYYRQWLQTVGSAQVIDFGLDSPAAVTASELKSGAGGGMDFELHTPAGSRRVKFSLLGRHNVMNALAAAAAAIAAGIDIETICEGLARVDAVPGRLYSQPQPGGYLLIDDSYNANPQAVKAAIDVLAGYSGRKFFLLGDMGELGEDSAALHAEVGRYARQKRIDFLWTIGDLASVSAKIFGGAAACFDDKAELIAEAQATLCNGDTVLIKGSRSAGMDEVVAALNANNNEGES